MSDDDDYAIGHTDGYESGKEEAAAHIAELEAERLILHDKCNEAARELGGLRIDYMKLEAERDRLNTAMDEIVIQRGQAQTECDEWQKAAHSAAAERDRLKAALEKIKQEADTDTHVFNLAYYALSDPSGE